MAKSTAQGIQIDEDRAHQRRGWRMERVAWGAMALVLVAATLGLFGYGPLSRATAGSPEGLSMEYDRFQRAKAPTEYRFDVDPALAADGRLRLRFDRSLLDEVELQSVVPEPEAVRAGPGYTEFEFAVAPGAQRAARVEFQFQPSTFGRVRGRVSAPGAPPAIVDQIVFP